MGPCSAVCPAGKVPSGGGGYSCLLYNTDVTASRPNCTGSPCSPTGWETYGRGVSNAQGPGTCLVTYAICVNAK